MWQKIISKISHSLSDNHLKRHKIYYSCVVDASSLFYWQTWGLVNSLIQIAKVSPTQIFVHYTLEVDQTFLQQLNILGVNLKSISRFGDGKYCNKIVQLDTREFAKAKCVFFLDTDMVVLDELEELYIPKVIRGKVVDLANPELSVLQAIFKRAGFSDTPSICNADCEKNSTFENNFNGGLYVVPGVLIPSLGKRWQHWALWLLANLEILEKVNKQNHVDQISFALATHELSLVTQNIDRQYNYPIHLSNYKTGNPKVLHYHRNISPTGMLVVGGEQDVEFKRAVQNANHVLGKSFNNQIFWSFRYHEFPQLGSGIGSRGENLLYKRKLLKTLGIETSQSILDVGCGDLEVIKNFNLPNYIGVDISSEAVNIAKQKRPDLDFILLDYSNNNHISKADLVICLEVLIHQQNLPDYQKVINFLAQKTINRLVVSGYVVKETHHDNNYMINFHESLLDSLAKTKQFSRIEVLGQHSDVQIILATK
ncbi:class I SAM-dependent methyltransferase [Pleurocapsa sp. FMAR1]|uniref:class I SAM-dependent methyltransferase n=1 Tax=Pleurocapsa sp. FMAR1 TaxID=3040204 RepID=UPI0029C63AF2|nr:class I SAM-dependent methyltransferase [Pleurocapsa sp. FMAR1]